jgi:hypothetical protein
MEDFTSNKPHHLHYCGCVFTAMVFVFMTIQRRHNKVMMTAKRQRYCCVTVPVNVRDRMLKDAEEQAEQTF